MSNYPTEADYVPQDNASGIKKLDRRLDLLTALLFGMGEIAIAYMPPDGQRQMAELAEDFVADMEKGP